MQAADLGPVPEAEKTQSPVDLFLIIAGANLVATTLQTGASLAPAFGLGRPRSSRARRHRPRHGARRRAHASRASPRRPVRHRLPRGARPARRRARLAHPLRHELRVDRREQRDRGVRVRARFRRTREREVLGVRARPPRDGRRRGRAARRPPRGSPRRAAPARRRRHPDLRVLAAPLGRDGRARKRLHDGGARPRRRDRLPGLVAPRLRGLPALHALAAEGRGGRLPRPRG